MTEEFIQIFAKQIQASPQFVPTFSYLLKLEGYLTLQNLTYLGQASLTLFLSRTPITALWPLLRILH